MNPPIQKLAIVFLVVAVLTSSLALGVSAFINRSPANSGLPQPGSANGVANGSAPALTPNQPSIGGGANGENLTDGVTSIFAQQIVNANPAGPTAQQNGLVALLFPTSTDVSSYLATNYPSAAALTPPLDDSKIQVINQPTQSDVLNYLSVVSQTASDLSSNPAWQGVLAASAATSTSASSSASEADLLNQAKEAMNAARVGLYAVKVPAVLLEYHKSLLALTETLATFLNVANDDPVAGTLLARNLQDTLDKEAADLNRTGKEVQSKLPGLVSSLPPKDERSPLAKMFGVPTAYAFLGFGDIVFDPAAVGGIFEQIGIWVSQHWQGILLGQLRNIIVQRLSQKVIEWAEGNGVPGYVVNWLSFQAGAQIAAREGFISKATAMVCGNAATVGVYGDILASALDSPSGLKGTRQTLGDNPNCWNLGVLDPNASNDDKDVRRWNGFFYSLQNNPLDVVMNIRDNAEIAAADASQAALNEALSGRGALDVKKCDDGSAVDSAGLCADGNPARTITLASTKQDLISKAVTNTFDLITGSNNQDLYESLANAVANALITYALDKGAGLFESSGGKTPPPPAPDLPGQIAQYTSILNRALANENQALSNLDSAIQILRSSVPQICKEGPAIDAAAQKASGLEATKAAVTTRRDHVQALITALGQVSSIDQLASRIGSLTGVTDLANKAADDDAASNDSLVTANGILQSCTK